MLAAILLMTDNFRWTAEGVSLWIKQQNTSYFYCTGNILYTYFLNYFPNFFFKVQFIGSTEVKSLLLLTFFISHTKL
jgi:hypothetical protein